MSEGPLLCVPSQSRGPVAWLPWCHSNPPSTGALSGNRITLTASQWSLASLTSGRGSPSRVRITPRSGGVCVSLFPRLFSFSQHSCMLVNKECAQVSCVPPTTTTTTGTMEGLWMTPPSIQACHNVNGNNPPTPPY